MGIRTFGVNNFGYLKGTVTISILQLHTKRVWFIAIMAHGRDNNFAHLEGLD